MFWHYLCCYQLIHLFVYDQLWVMKQKDLKLSETDPVLNVYLQNIKIQIAIQAIVSCS